MYVPTYVRVSLQRGSQGVITTLVTQTKCVLCNMFDCKLDQLYLVLHKIVPSGIIIHNSIMAYAIHFPYVHLFALRMTMIASEPKCTRVVGFQKRSVV